MNLGHLSLGAGLVVLALSTFAGIGAGADADPGATAVKACTTANGHQPASLVTAIDDGRGGSLVWLTDGEANLWFCSADAAGKIYAYVVMTGDLLQGTGASLVPDESFGDDEYSVPLPDPNPLDIAELACKAYFPGDDPTKVVGRGQDGLAEKFVPGYFVFIESGGHTYLCDATADAQVWAFAEIGDPLGFADPVG
jgi:hypothetical protein